MSSPVVVKITGPVAVPTESEKYPKEEWLVPASDRKGHDRPTTVRIMPMMADDIAILVASKKFPYRTIPDLLRHAIKRHIHFLHGLEDTVIPETHLTQLEAIGAVLNETQRMVDFSESINDVKTLVERVLKGGTEQARRQASKLVLQIRGVAEQMQDPYYRQMYLQQLDNEFGYLQLPQVVTFDGDGDDEEDHAT